MKKCEECGNIVQKNHKKCDMCGAPIVRYKSTIGFERGRLYSEHETAIGRFFIFWLSLTTPILGLMFYFIVQKASPGYADAALKGFIVNVILSVFIFFVFLVVIL